MTITFNLCNVACNLVDTVMFRKFFQMVFVGKDRKSLNIYTATVLGGSSNVLPASDSSPLPKEKFISSLDYLSSFCVKFDIVVTGNDDNDVLSIVNEDITGPENRGFLSQEECIQRVWGKQCQVLWNNTTEKDLEAKYKDLIGKTLCIKKDLFAKMAQNTVLLIQDDTKESTMEMNSFAIPGGFSCENYIREQKTKKSERHSRVLAEGSEKATYQVVVPKGKEICKGIELLNWVKTTIRFEFRLSEQNLNFCIQKDIKDQTKYLAPDFTWYFSPPVKAFINHESSSVEVKWQHKNSSDDKCPLHEACKCPIKPTAEIPFTTKRYDNSINPVANKTTVNFQRWIEDEMIGFRQKYRIAARNIFPRPENFDDVSELNIYIDATDDHSRGNRQYILGILLSVALVFGINNEIVDGAKQFFPLNALFSADTWWLFMIISLALNLLIYPVRNIRNRVYKNWRATNIVASCIWSFSVFCVARSKLLSAAVISFIIEPVNKWVQSFATVPFDFYVISRGAFIILLISNVAYILYNIFVYRDPILSGFLGDDIL